jgi:hypothetical protein
VLSPTANRDRPPFITPQTRTPAEVVERYCDRWAIEVCSEEVKHQAGIGDAESRGEAAVRRAVPFQFLTMTLTL